MSAARLAAALLLVGCGLMHGPFDTAEGLAAQMEQAGIEVAALTVGATDLFPGASHSILCVDGQRTSVYTYESEAAAAAGAATIDPADPSTIGRSQVEWRGNPRFWQRGRLLVLYVGPRPATEALLTSILGPPFAQAIGRGWVGGFDGSC